VRVGLAVATRRRAGAGAHRVDLSCRKARSRRAQRGRLPDPADRRLQRLAATVRDRDARTAATPAPAFGAATAALLPASREAATRSACIDERFHAAVQEAKVGPDKDIPHVTAELIVKYMTDLQLLGLL
jgi:thioester reductase-like protein